jgi:thymidylate kinase
MLSFDRCLNMCQGDVILAYRKWLMTKAISFIESNHWSIGRMIKVDQLEDIIEPGTLCQVGQSGRNQKIVTKYPYVFIPHTPVIEYPFILIMTYETVYDDAKPAIAQQLQDIPSWRTLISEDFVDYLKKHKTVITIDGINGTGKTTCLEAINGLLSGSGIQYDTPIFNLVGSGTLGEILVKSFKGKRFLPEVENNLTKAACYDVAHNLVPKSLEENHVVAVSRWAGSYFVYQEVLAKGKDPNFLSEDAFAHINKLHSGVVPQLYFYCDGQKVSPEESRRRILSRGDQPDKHEQAEGKSAIREKMLQAFKTANDRIGIDIPIVEIDPSLPVCDMEDMVIGAFVKEIRILMSKEKIINPIIIPKDQG